MFFASQRKLTDSDPKNDVLFEFLEFRASTIFFGDFWRPTVRFFRAFFTNSAGPKMIDFSGTTEKSWVEDDFPFVQMALLRGNMKIRFPKYGHIFPGDSDCKTSRAHHFGGPSGGWLDPVRSSS